MPDTKRFQAISNIRNQLKTITTANGYGVDLGGQVFLGKLEHGQEVKPPFIALWEPFSETGPVELSDATRQSGRTTRDGVVKSRIGIKYYIQAFAAKSDLVDDPTGPAYELLGAIHQCLGSLDSAAQPFGADQAPGQFSIDWGLVRPGGDNISNEHPYALVTLNIKIVETRGNPYVE